MRHHFLSMGSWLKRVPGAATGLWRSLAPACNDTEPECGFESVAGRKVGVSPRRGRGRMRPSATCWMRDRTFSARNGDVLPLFSFRRRANLVYHAEREERAGRYRRAACSGRLRCVGGPGAFASAADDLHAAMRCRVVGGGTARYARRCPDALPIGVGGGVRSDGPSSGQTVTASSQPRKPAYDL